MQLSILLPRNVQSPSSRGMSNGQLHPMDEAPNAYKDFCEVLASLEKAGLATEAAELRARYAIKTLGEKELRASPWV